MKRFIGMAVLASVLLLVGAVAAGSSSPPAHYISCTGESRISQAWGSYYLWGGTTSCNSQAEYISVTSLLYHYEDGQWTEHDDLNRQCWYDSLCPKSELDVLWPGWWYVGSLHIMDDPIHDPHHWTGYSSKMVYVPE